MNKKIALFLSVFCFATVFVIGVYFFFKIKEINSSGDIRLNRKTIEHNTDKNDKDNVTSITISWDIVPNGTSYNLYWSHKSGVTKKNGNKINNVNPPYTFNHAEKGATYYFVVTAVNKFEESDESEEIIFQMEE